MPVTKWDPVKYNQVADFVAKLGEPLISLLAPKPSDLLLDVGCGDGYLTEKLEGLCQRIIGIDSSPEMVKAAQNKGIEAYVKDAQRLDFQQTFDGVISNAALHWMKTPKNVIDGVFNALKPGGVFVAEFGGFGNAARIVDALTLALTQRGISFDNPWYFPTAEAYTSLLKEQGFTVQHCELFERFTPLPEHLREWILTFAQSFFSHANETDMNSIIEEVIEEVKPDLHRNGQWHVDYVRLRIKAQKL